MTETRYPLGGLPFSQASWSRTVRHFQTTGVYGDPTGTALKVTADSSGMTVALAAGEAIIRGHHYQNDASLNLTIAAANATNPRIDLVVLRLDPDATPDANKLKAIVITGTAAGSPTAPAITQSDAGDYDLPLAEVRVEAAAVTIAAAKVTDIRGYAAKAIVPCLSTRRPTGERGLFIFETDTGVARYWNGSAWIGVSPDSHTHVVNAGYSLMAAAAAGGVDFNSASGSPVVLLPPTDPVTVPSACGIALDLSTRVYALLGGAIAAFPTLRVFRWNADDSDKTQIGSIPTPIYRGGVAAQANVAWSRVHRPSAGAFKFSVESVAATTGDDVICRTGAINLDGTLVRI